MATKPDLNTHVSDTGKDGLPGSLAEREARVYRRDPAFWRGTAMAVTGPGDEGIALTTPVEELLSLVLWELRSLRMAMTFAGTAHDLEDGLEHDV